MHQNSVAQHPFHPFGQCSHPSLDESVLRLLRLLASSVLQYFGLLPDELCLGARNFSVLFELKLPTT
ncbi:hypothetical protein MPL1032_30005 [Mesorhizobium plurifarium]|uniref:Uncharacterized protein n=1 Tax=Mesorhizobium plurifarium TaxID=69974 RepID=A0A0K2W2D7_MESPL|nr:hypothetical protein MPL1032_30005 [Mesorhizobium plurifarium]